MALLRLADIMGNATISRRSPTSPISFSCLPQETVQAQTDLLSQYRKGERQAFSPLGPDGKPIRRYSTKHRDHWFHGGKDGLSVAKAGTIERAVTKFDPDREKTSSGLRGDHAEDRYARKHNAGDINIARLSPISTNRSAESRTYTQHIQTSTNR